MSTDKPELENTIRLAIEAADAANAAAADIAEMKRQYTDASSKIESARTNLVNVSLGLVAGIVVATGASGFMFFNTLGTFNQTHATQIEALALFTTSIAELRTEIAGVQELAVTMQENSSISSEAATSLQAAADSVSTQIDNFQATITAEMERMTQETIALQPQIATSLRESVDESFDELRIDVGAKISDLQVSLSKLIAKGFESMPTTNVVANSTPATPKPAPPKKTTPTKSNNKVAKKSTPKPPPNPFKFP